MATGLGLGQTFPFQSTIPSALESTMNNLEPEPDFWSQGPPDQSSGHSEDGSASQQDICQECYRPFSLPYQLRLVFLPVTLKKTQLTKFLESMRKLTASLFSAISALTERLRSAKICTVTIGSAIKRMLRQIIYQMMPRRVLFVVRYTPGAIIWRGTWKHMKRRRKIQLEIKVSFAHSKIIALRWTVFIDTFIGIFCFVSRFHFSYVFMTRISPFGFSPVFWDAIRG